MGSFRNGKEIIPVVPDYIIAASDASAQEKGRADVVCDGTADDVTINAYLALLPTGYGTVQLTGGSFDISDTISIPYGASLKGQGSGQDVTGGVTTKLNWTGSGVKDIIIYNSAAVGQGTDRRGSRIANLSIDGNDVADSTGIEVRSSFYHIIENVFVYNTGSYGIVVGATFTETIRDCEIRLSGNAGILLDEYDGTGNTVVNIERCVIERNTNYNLEIKSAWPLNLNSNWFENASTDTGTHIHIDGTAYDPQVNATDNTFGALRDADQCILMDGGVCKLWLNHNYLQFEQTGEQGVVMATGELFAHGNWFDGVDDYAINITGSVANVGEVVVIGNFFDKCGIQAIGGQLLIEGNTFVDVATTYGIYINVDGTFPTIEGNRFYDLDNNGIYTKSGRSNINGNTIIRCGQGTDNTYDAVIIDADRCIVNDNIIYSNHANTQRYGVSVVNQNYIQICNNQIEDSATYDIRVTQGSYYEITNNMLPDGNIIFPFNATDVYRDNIGWDEALIADGQFLGEVIDGTAGAVLAFGDLCYLAVADSRWELTDADAEATAGPIKLGICVLAAVGDGSVTKLLLRGKVRADAAFPALTIGAPVYVGVTAGDIQVAAPVGNLDIVRIVGYANTADELYFCPDNTYLEIAV